MRRSRWGRRVTAAVMAVLMTVNTQAGIFASLAAERSSGDIDAVDAVVDEQTIRIEAADFMDAVTKALESEQNFTEDISWLDMQSGGEAYRKMLDQDGVYELYPEMERGQDVQGEVRAFICMGESEELTGDEQVMFLFTNDTEDVVYQSLEVGDVKIGDVEIPSYWIGDDDLVVTSPSNASEKEKDDQIYDGNGNIQGDGSTGSDLNEDVPVATPGSALNMSMGNLALERGSLGKLEKSRHEVPLTMAAFGDRKLYADSEGMADGYRLLGAVEWGASCMARAAVVRLKDIGMGAALLADTTAEAKIDGKEYNTLKEALKAVRDGETIVLQRDVEIEADDTVEITNANGIAASGLELPEGTYTLDLNGNNVDRHNDSGKLITCFAVRAGSQVTIKNGRVDNYYASVFECEDEACSVIFEKINTNAEYLTKCIGEKNEIAIIEGGYNFYNNFVEVFKGKLHIQSSYFVQENGWDDAGFTMYLKGSLTISGSSTFIVNGPLFDFQMAGEGSQAVIENGHFVRIQDSTDSFSALVENYSTGQIEIKGSVETNQEYNPNDAFLKDISEFSVGEKYATVEFYDGGIQTAVYEIDAGDVLSELPEPQRSSTGEFLGWFTAKEQKADTGMIITKDMVFYAVYSDTEYKVTFQGTTESEPSVIAEVPFGTVLKNIQEGYGRYLNTPGFKGWLNEYDKFVPEDTRIISDITLHPAISTVSVNNYDDLERAIAREQPYIVIEGDIDVIYPLEIEYKVHIISKEGTKHKLRGENEDVSQLFDIFGKGELLLENLVLENPGNAIVSTCGEAVIKNCETDREGATAILCSVNMGYDSLAAGKVTVDGGNYILKYGFINVENGSAVIKSGTFIQAENAEDSVGFHIENGSVSILDGEFLVNNSLFRVPDYSSAEKKRIMMAKGVFSCRGSGPIVDSSYWDKWITIANGMDIDANAENLDEIRQFKVGPFGKKVMFSAGDSITKEIRIPYGETLSTLPEAPADLTGDFLGWFTSDMIKAEIGMPVDRNMTFYAIDSGMTYTVELCREDGSQDTVHKNVPWGTALKELDGGYGKYDDIPGFKGWYNESDTVVPGDVRVTSDMKLRPVISAASVADFEALKEAVQNDVAYIRIEGDIIFKEPLEISYPVTIVSDESGRRKMYFADYNDLFYVTESGGLSLEGLEFARHEQSTLMNCCVVVVDQRGTASIKDCTMNMGDIDSSLATVYGDLKVEGGSYKTGGTVITVGDSYHVSRYDARLTIYNGSFEADSYDGTINNSNIVYLYGGDFHSTFHDAGSYALAGSGRYNFMDGCQPEPFENWETSYDIHIAGQGAEQNVTVEFYTPDGLIESLKTSKGGTLLSWPENPSADGQPLFELWMGTDFKEYNSDSIFLQDTKLYAMFGDKCTVLFTEWQEGPDGPVPVMKAVEVARKTKFGDIPQFREAMQTAGFLEWMDTGIGKAVTAEDTVCDNRTLVPCYFSEVKDFESLQSALKEIGQVKEIRIAEKSVIEVTEPLELRRGMSIDGNGAVLKRAPGFEHSLLTVRETINGSSTVKDVIFDGEDYMADSAAIVVSRDGDLKLQDCVIQNNKSRYLGGGIFNEGKLELSDGVVIRNNWSRKNGGGICNGSASYDSDTDKSVKLVMRGDVCVSDNHSEENGGGIHTSGQLEIYDDVSVFRNRAKKLGGGINIVARLSALHSGHIYDNLAGDTDWAGDDIYKTVSLPGPLRSTASPVDGHFKVFEKQQGRRYGDGSITNPDTMVVPLPYKDAPEPDEDIIIPYKGWFADDIQNRYQNLENSELVLYQKGSNHILDKRLEGGESNYGLKAIWHGLVVLYHPNGGNGTAYYDKTAYTWGEEAEILSNDRAGNIFTRPGFIFTGWNTKADGTGTAYAPDDIMRMKTSAALYAQWEKAEEVTVTYQWVTTDNPTDVSVPVERNTCYKGLAYSSIPQSPTSQKYKFDGWYIDRECTKAYVDGTVLTGNLILYGAWSKNTDVPDDPEKVPVNITYQWVSVKNPTDVSVPKESSIFYKGDAYKAIPQEPTRQKYEFAGWYTDRGCRYAYIDGTELTGDLILYGKWRKTGGGDSSGGGGGGSDSHPTDPQPTEPQPTDPQPTDPQPTDPQPTDPQPVTPQPERPVKVDRIPDSNDPSSPVYIILESPDGVPKAYMKIWNAEQNSYIYMPVDLPKTGDTRKGDAAAWFFLASGMLFVILMNDKKKKGSKREKRG